MLINMRCALVFICIIIDLHPITFHFIIYYYKNECIFSIVFSEVALRAAK
jgi:hypothetical protein